MTRVVCLSDTHNKLDQLTVPDGDILIHAGDATMMGKHDELKKFNAHLKRLPHKYKVIIAGNHDWMWESDRARAEALVPEAIYLMDSGIEVAGVKIYGSPWTPMFHNWAFNAERGHPIRKFWNLIPDGLDILVTHGPPRGYGDVVSGAPRSGGMARHNAGRGVGCDDLLFATQRAKPGYHVFGHIHEGYGMYRSHYGTTYINASNCDEHYAPVNEPVVLEL